jgi:hypothetical protein
VHRQLATELPARDGIRGLVISASKELEPGARAMLLLADGLFRLDVLVYGDSMRTVVRNLSSGPVEMQSGTGGTGGTGGAAGQSISFGEVSAYQPGRADLGFTIGPGDDRLLVKVTLATVRFVERGTVRVSGQAVVRSELAAGAA